MHWSFQVHPNRILKMLANGVNKNLIFKIFTKRFSIIIILKNCKVTLTKALKVSIMVLRES